MCMHKIISFKNKQLHSNLMRLLLILLMVILLLDHIQSVKCDSNDPLDAPALYVLGDSLVDSGNNNLLPTLAKADFLPYGANFPRGPTGRFTNGRTTVDFIGTKTIHFTISFLLHFFGRQTF